MFEHIWLYSVRKSKRFSHSRRTLISTRPDMGFGIFLDEVSTAFFVGQRAEPFNASMLPFTLLNSLLKTIDLESFEVDASQKVGECCICLESFHSRSDFVLTKCRHAFHPVCLTSSLCSIGAGSSCPLCRASFDEQLLSAKHGRDRDLLRQLCTVRGGSIDGAESSPTDVAGLLERARRREQDRSTGK